MIHLLMFNSDHCPLWIWSRDLSNSQRNPKSFKFIAVWLSHDSFEGLVRDNWKGELHWEDYVREFTSAASLWNKHTFGHIQNRK